MNLKKYIENLPSELQEKARACNSVEELLALAKEAKAPVPDEALEAIAGGDGSDPENCQGGTCPKCGSTNVIVTKEEYFGFNPVCYMKCNDCGYQWKE